MNKYFKKWLLFLVSLTTCGLLAKSFCPLETSANTIVNNSPKFTNSSEQITYISFWGQKANPNNVGNLNMTLYRSPSCSCCGAWIDHIKEHGFRITEDIKTESIAALKQKLNVPPKLASCHTAIIDGYIIEGHVPADDIKRFLRQKPQVAGLAVPGMVIGTPGMEMGDRQQPFQVLAFNNKGEVEVFQEY
ncbi:putative metal-binding protein [Xenococcus sp. PCC 7305]|uniref:DUF411 domain-containing protein n=1 Tax=Xenococcus sp. PCC 7305 TaxID=102125 RepID=UPI0002AC28D3|nr:DUF411 domain-containing protein [Xenococcus sp. PCC 7305]ELS02454.1 putative metal-binding protein [Xenococcus sp. PCC 7305]